MLTDRMTARVLGLLVLALTFLIVTSCFIFARPEIRGTARYAVVVIVPSLPLVAVGLLLLRKASRMKEDEEEK
jgi:hypothetical protein